MLFSSIPFLYYFFPAVLMVYFAVPRAFKNAVLLLASLIFYGWGEPVYLLLMVATIALFYICGLLIGKYEGDRKKQKLWLTVSVAVSLAFLGIFKYADFFIDSFNAVTGLGIPFLRLALPIGISFYTFQCLSYTIDVYRGNVPAQKNPITFGAYVALFPQLIAGPIVRYVDVVRELETRTHSWDDFAQGMRRFLVGLAKKVLIADNFALLMRIYEDSANHSVLFGWMYAVAFMMNIYFDFSGYSCMAIGMGRMLGFRFIENFNYPYISASIQEFWRRWHMSLGSWFRDYVYIPLGGNRVSKGRWVFNTLAVWMLTGLWHGASWNFVLWGLMFAVLLMIEKWVSALKKLPSAVKHFYVLFLVLISFVIFNHADYSAVTVLGEMFGFKGLAFANSDTLYYLRSFAPLFIAAFIGATPVVKTVAAKVGQTKVGAVLEILLMAALLIVCTAYLVDGSFSPFLYFRF